MITTKSYLIREISRLKKKRRKLKNELVTIGQSGQVKNLFKIANSILEKELIVIDATIEAYLWVANTNQKSLPKIKNKKKKPNTKEKEDD